MKFAVKNLELVPESEARVPVSIREVFFNFSVYESLKVLKGVAVFLEDHLDRLLESASRLMIPHDYTRTLLGELVYKLIQADSIDRATLRIQLIGGSEPMLFIFYTDLPIYPAHYYSHGVQTITYEGERIIPEVKSTSLLLNYVALREAERKDAFEALLVDRWGCSIEGTRTNLFAVTGSKLITAGAGVLAGVTRKHIIESAQKIGMTVEFACIQVREIKGRAFDELFLSSTSMGAIPISHVDGMRVSVSCNAAIRIHELVRNLESDYVNSQGNTRGN